MSYHCGPKWPLTSEQIYDTVRTVTDADLYNSMSNRQQELLHRFFPESKFGSHSDIDGTVAFFGRIRSLIDESSVVCDVGCGHDRKVYLEDPSSLRKDLRDLKSKCKRLIGIDTNPGAINNSWIDEFRLIDSDRWPIDDESIDLAYSDFVLEHVEAPAHFFGECARVIKPGGYLCMRTPNKWGYVAILSRMIPSRFHQRVITDVQLDREAVDIYPAYYRCNSRRRIRGMLTKHGFEQHCVYGYEAEPSYMSFSRVCYFLAVLHEKFAPGLLKLTIFTFARKTSRQV